MLRIIFVLSLALSFFGMKVFAAGTVTVSKSQTSAFGGSQVPIQIVQVDWTGDASDGSVPTKSIQLGGYVLKVVTNPGSTAPSANYDIALGDPEDSALDALASALLNRHTSNTEQVYPAIAGAPGTVSSLPVFLEPGAYTLAVTGNSVNSATGRILIYLSDRR